MGLNLQRQVWEDLRDLSRHLQREAILSVRGEVSERIAATQEVTAQVVVEQDLQILLLPGRLLSQRGATWKFTAGLSFALTLCSSCGYKLKIR